MISSLVPVFFYELLTHPFEPINADLIEFFDEYLSWLTLIELLYIRTLVISFQAEERKKRS